MKTFEGKVVSDRMAKTAVVLIERQYRHPMYGKIISRKKKIHAENEMGAKSGEKVTIAEIKPKAKTVFFRITAILDKEAEKK